MSDNKIGYERIIRWAFESGFNSRVSALIERLVRESREAGIPEDLIKIALENVHSENRIFDFDSLDVFREPVEAIGGTLEEFSKVMDECEKALFDEIIRKTLLQ